MQAFTEIVTSFSAIIVALTVILASFTKVRKWLVNKIASDVDFSKIDKRSELYLMHEKTQKHESQKDEIFKQIKDLLEAQNKGFKESIEKQNRHLDELRRSTLRLEIGRLLDHEPKNSDTIHKLYDEYLRMGGNSYMVSRIEKWKKEIGES